MTIFSLIQRHIFGRSTRSAGSQACPLWLLLAVLLLQSCGITVGQVLPAASAQLAVDIVTATGQRELRGMLLPRSGNLQRIALRRDWLGAHEPAFLEQLQADEQSERAEAHRVLGRRVDDWLAATPVGSPLHDFLRAEQARLAIAPADAQPPQASSEFLIASLPAAEVRRTYRQSERRHQLAAVAWDLGLEDVEETPVAQLEANVSSRDPHWFDRHPNLADRLPAGLSQSDKVWQMRQAIVEHRLLPSPVEFQGTADLLLPARAGVPADIASLADGLVQSLGSRTLPDQGSPADWRKQATDAAGNQHRRSVRITRVLPDPPAGQVTVESTFLFDTTESGWVTGWRVVESASVKTARAGALDQVRSDPQVEQIVSLARQLGLESTVDQALAVGAVTLDLQQQVNDRWFEFSDRLMRRLDAPPLFLLE